MDKMTEIASMIKEHRKLAGLTQAELGHIVGLGKTTIFDIEKGKETVRFANLLKVLDSLNISIELSSRYKEEHR